MRRKTTDLQERALLFLHDFQPRKTGEIREALGKPKGWDTVGFLRRIQGSLINSKIKLQCVPACEVEKTWQLKPRAKILTSKRRRAYFDTEKEYPCWITGVRDRHFYYKKSGSWWVQ